MKKFIIVIALFTALSGCSSPQSTFYVLNPVPIKSRHVIKTVRLNIGLGPIVIPEYLQQPQMVTYVADNELMLNEFHRWAEPLQSNIVRVVQSDLSGLLPYIKFHKYPWRQSANIKYRVKVNISQFDMDNHNNSILRAKYEISLDKNGQKPFIKTVYYQTAVGSRQYRQLVACMNYNLAQLSHSIAKDLRKVISRR